jgi:hypothetical protein
MKMQRVLSYFSLLSWPQLVLSRIIIIIIIINFCKEWITKERFLHKSILSSITLEFCIATMFVILIDQQFFICTV